MINLNQVTLSGAVRGKVQYYDDRDCPRAIFTLVQKTSKECFFIKATKADLIVLARSLAHDDEIVVEGVLFSRQDNIGVLVRALIRIAPSSTTEAEKDQL